MFPKILENEDAQFSVTSATREETNEMTNSYFDIVLFDF